MESEYDTEVHKRALVEALDSQDAQRIPRQELQFEDHRIGTGGFGDVLLAVWEPRKEGTPGDVNRWYVAVKWLTPQHHTFLRLALRFARELKVWSTFEHPNILPFWGFNIDLGRSEAYFVSPYFPRGNMRTRLDTDAAITIEQRKKWVLDITQSLDYLHSLDPPVVHGDLKSPNIILDDTDSAMLCDFGLSSVVEETSTGLTTSGGFNASPRWCSPELLEGGIRTAASDMWAWALCVLEITTGHLPFHNIKNEVTVVTRILIKRRYPSREEYPELPTDNRIWETLEKCFRKKPTERPFARECLIQLSLVPPPCTLSIIKSWEAKDASILDVSRSGRLVLVSYKDAVLASSNTVSENLVIENLDTGDTMYIMSRKATRLRSVVGKLHSFSADEREWAWYDEDEGCLYIYEIQGTATRLVANIGGRKLSRSLQYSQLYFTGEPPNRQLLLFHCHDNQDTVLGLLSVLPDREHPTISYRSLPKGKDLRKGSMSPNSRYFALIKCSSHGYLKTEVYTTRSLLSFVADSSAAFPEPIFTAPYSTVDTGFWISTNAYAVLHRGEFRFVNVENDMTRWIAQPSYPPLTFLLRNDPWLVFRRAGKSLQFIYTPTIVANSSRIDEQISSHSPHFRHEIEDGVDNAFVQWARPDIVIFTYGGFYPSHSTARRIHKPSPWW